MSWIPGWDSIAGTHWWENFYFWGSIVALILLGAAEVISHRYTERKDELTAIEQRDIQRQHDKDVAELHLQTSQADERAAKLEKEAAAANERAAAIMKATAWREFTADQSRSLTQSLSLQSGKLVFAWIANDAESFSLAAQFANLLSGFPHSQWDLVNSAKVYPVNLVWGIVIPDVPEAAATVQLLRDAFTRAGIAFSTDTPPKEPMSFGPSDSKILEGRAIVLFGSRKPSFAQPP